MSKLTVTNIIKGLKAGEDFTREQLSTLTLKSMQTLEDKMLDLNATENINKALDYITELIDTKVNGTAVNEIVVTKEEQTILDIIDNKKVANSKKAPNKKTNNVTNKDTKEDLQNTKETDNKTTKGKNEKGKEVNNNKAPKAPSTSKEDKEKKALEKLTKERTKVFSGIKIGDEIKLSINEDFEDAITKVVYRDSNYILCQDTTYAEDFTKLTLDNVVNGFYTKYIDNKKHNVNITI